MLKTYLNIRLLRAFITFCITFFITGLNASSFSSPYISFSVSAISINSLGSSRLDTTLDNSFSRYTTGFETGANYGKGVSFAFGSYLTDKISLESHLDLLNRTKIRKAQFTNIENGEKLADLSNQDALVQDVTFVLLYDFYKNDKITLKAGLGSGLLYFEDDMAGYNWLFEDDQIFYNFSLRFLYSINEKFDLALSYDADYSRRLHDIHKILELNYKQENYLSSYFSNDLKVGIVFKF